MKNGIIVVGGVGGYYCGNLCKYYKSGCKDSSKFCCLYKKYNTPHFLKENIAMD
jgi:hypothetical protein